MDQGREHRYFGVARNRGVGVVPSFRASALCLRKVILVVEFRYISAGLLL